MLRFFTGLLCLLTSCVWSLQAQGEISFNTKQSGASINGYVKDRGTERPLAGVLVEVLNMRPRQAALTDSSGFFRLEDLPQGRYRLLLYLEGYEQEFVPDVIADAGQLLSIDIYLQKEVVQVVFDSSQIKRVQSSRGRPYNPLSGIATRPFTPEEVLRYAGARFDPALLVTNFAGVNSYDDARNDIVVRGNSPSSLLWQIEELPIENPNHITVMGRAGGAIPILSMFTMGKADFAKGVLSAQYGNTTAGVFDIYLREGNRNRFGGMVALGLQRGEVLLEGPLNKSGGSFMVGARNSGLGQFLSRFIPTDPQHQDLSFKLQFGDQAWGKLELFGVGGLSRIFIPYTEGSIVEKIRYQIFEFQDYAHRNQMGLAGLKYSLNLGEGSFWRTIAGVSYHGNQAYWDNNDLSDPAQPVVERSYTIDNRRLNYLGHSYIQSQKSKSLLWRSGLMFNGYQLNLLEVSDFFQGGVPDTDFQGFRYSARAYAQARWSFAPQWMLFAGLSSMYNNFNGELSFDPRSSLSWSFRPGHQLSVGAGLSHQMPNIENLYFNPVVGYDTQGEALINYQGRQLRNMRSLMFDLEYSWSISENWRFRAQAYWQRLDRVFVEDSLNGTGVFSIINSESTFYAVYYNALENRGLGENQGLEFTLERFFDKGYYVLASGSIFNSRYTGTDGLWREKAFSNRYIVNLLAGKEWRFGANKQHVFFSDLRFSTRGGRPYRPIDAEATYQQGFQSGGLEPVFDDERAYRVRTPAFYQVDAKLGLRLNNPKQKLTQTIRLDLFNVFNIRNVFTYQYSAVFNPFGQPERGEIIPIYQRGFIPDLTYILQF